MPAELDVGLGFLRRRNGFCRALRQLALTLVVPSNPALDLAVASDGDDDFLARLKLDGVDGVDVGRIGHGNDQGLALGIATQRERKDVVLHSEVERDLGENASVQVVRRRIGDGHVELLRQDPQQALLFQKAHLHNDAAKPTTPLALVAEGRLELDLVEETRIYQKLAKALANHGP